MLLYFDSWCFCLCVLAVVTLSNTQNLERETCNAARSEVDVEVASAGALIGGIFHIRDSLMGGYTCGTPHTGRINIDTCTTAYKPFVNSTYIPLVTTGCCFFKVKKTLFIFFPAELIQVYEAAKFAIQRVNAQNIVPGIRLGEYRF